MLTVFLSGYCLFHSRGSREDEETAPPVVPAANIGITKTNRKAFAKNIEKNKMPGENYPACAW
jgi:hypothetical protein